MRPQWAPLLVLLAALALSAASCADDPKGNTDTSDTSTNPDGGPDLIGGDTIGGDTGPVGDCDTARDPGGDADGDGIINGAEDRNNNCIHEPDQGETDPTLADSDADGKPDGDEDLNGNGIFEPDLGETDANNSDTDGNGIPDGAETAAVVCTRDLLASIEPSPAQFAKSNLALPTSYSIEQHQTASGATFSDPTSGAYGFIVSIPAASNNPDQENGQALFKVGQAGNLPTLDFAQRYTIPNPEWPADTIVPVPTVEGVRTAIRFQYGAGFPNSGTASKTPGELRDEVISALSGATVSTGEMGDACASLQTNWISQLRIDQAQGNKLVVMGIISCEDTVTADEDLQFVFEDVISGTILAPGTYRPTGFLCEELEPRQEPGSADFLWVIDNSGSMADEQGNVAATVETFLQVLGNSGVDWRLGVTTTESYVLDPNEQEFQGARPSLDHDELINLTTGLREPGFITPSTPGADELFRRNVIHDTGCVRESGGVPLGDPDDNICGHGFERGAISAAVVLDRLAVNTTAAGEEVDPHALREGAKRIIIWVSDEENQDVRTADGVLPPSDPAFQQFVTNVVERYTAHEALPFAIVGDAGKANGGVCELLDLSNGAAVVGAIPGVSYIEIARALGGAESSICTDDLRPAIQRIIDLVIGSVASYSLKGLPISSSIRVAVDGQVVPRSKTAGWNYDASSNSIVFFGNTRPSVSSQIAVAYLLWEEFDG